MAEMKRLHRWYKAVRRWYRQHPAWCWIFKWHWLRFVRKEADGQRLLRCKRCGYERYTRLRGGRKPA